MTTRQAMYIERKVEERSCNHRCRGKAISITYSECVSVAVVIKHTMRMSRITLSSVAWPAVQHFSTLHHKRHDFRKKEKKVGHKTCALIFFSTFI
jgi:hypothetical protein